MAIRLIRTFTSTTNELKSKCREFTLRKRFSQEELDEFSKLTGDLNILHSTETPLPQRRVHGAFLNAIVSGIMGTFMPGPGTIVLEQNFKFPNACLVDVDVDINVRLVTNRKISRVEYICRQNEDIVLEGEAKLLTKGVIK